MRRLAGYITDYMIQHNIESEDERELCIYSYECLLSKVFGNGIFIVMGILLNRFVPTLLFMLGFLGLRERTGGFHMKSRKSCVLVSVIAYLMMIYLGERSFINTGLSKGLIILLSVFIILLYAPVNHPNLNLSKEEIRQSRLLSIVRLGILLICIVIIDRVTFLKMDTVYLVLGIGLDALGIILAKMKKQEVRM